MKKLLSTFLALFFIGGLEVFAENFLFNATDIQNVGIKDAGYTANNGTFTFKAMKNNGSTNPAFNSNDGDVRLYAKNTLTITNSAGNMTKIVFNISTQGKTRLAEVTASTGTIATQAVGDEIVTWVGDASEVTFTVGDRAEYGSDGREKAGRLVFFSLVITSDAGSYGDTLDPAPDPTNLQTVDNIAAFKALADGTEAILKLNNAQVLYSFGNDVYVRDNSGAIDFFKTDLGLTTGQVLNGSVIGKNTFYNKTPELAKTENTKADKITATAGTATAKTLTIAEAKNEANICDLIKITGAKIVSKDEGWYTNLYACIGNDEIMIYDRYRLVEGTIDKNETYDVEGILIIYKDVYELYLTKDYTNGQGEEPSMEYPTEEKLPYSIDFTNGQGGFTINDVVLPEGLNLVWSNSSSYGMKAFGYYQLAFDTESWLVSPVFDLTDVTAPVLTFAHTGRYFNNMQEEATLWAKVEGGEWEQLSIPTWFTNNDWNFVDAQVDLSKYVGKKITLGFKYISTSAAAATWGIKTLSIDEVKEHKLVIQGEQEFETSTTVTIVPSNPDNEICYTIDGSDPVSSSTAIQYTKPFTLTETTTVKAFEEGAELYVEMTFTKKEVQQGDDVPVKCEKPTITLLASGKIRIESATEGTKCVTNITASNAEPFVDEEIDLKTPLIVYTVTAFATADGHEDSEIATATFRWEKTEGDMNDDGIVNIADVIQLVNMILSPTKEKNFVLSQYDIFNTNNSIYASTCAKPSIILIGNDKIKVESATEGARCITNITASNVEPLTDGEISLNIPLTVYTIKAYATAEGYADSDEATATFRWEKTEGDMNGDGTVNIADVVQLVNMILGN